MSEEPAKVIKLIVSVGEGDDRDLAQFLEDAKQALREHADAKNVTSMGGYYLVNGQPVREDGTHYLNGNADATVDTPPEAPKKKKKKKPKPKPEKEEPKPEATTPSQEETTRALAKKVTGSKKLSLRKGGDA